MEDNMKEKAVQHLKNLNASKVLAIAFLAFCLYIGSAAAPQLVSNSRAALAEGKTVYLYTPGLSAAPKNRALAASLAAAQRELKNWGVIFTDGGRKRLITAEEARALRLAGQTPGPGAVLTPLAREIMEGTK